jgi:hypothetical protein
LQSSIDNKIQTFSQADKIYNTFGDVIQIEKWSQKMSTHFHIERLTAYTVFHNNIPKYGSAA